MNKRSSDPVVQDDPLMRLANQSCIDEVTRLLNAVSGGHSPIRYGEARQLPDDQASPHTLLQNGRAVRHWRLDHSG